jgi:dihydroneopterin aldolase
MILLKMAIPNGSDKVADKILIHGLEVAVRIGVPDEERVGWQTLRVDLVMHLKGRVEAFEDQIEQTVDYDAVARGLRGLAGERPRHLIETLAGEMAGFLLADFPLSAVEITLRKRVLPGVDWVAVSVFRES